MSLDPAKLLLGYQEAGPNPALSLIAGVPSFHVGANPFDNREGGLDDRGATLVSLFDARGVPTPSMRTATAACDDL